MELTYSVKFTHFNPDDSIITNLFLMTNEQMGIKTHEIKFSIKRNQDHDDWYLISSINPIKIWGGCAGTYVECPFKMYDEEQDIINTILGWDSDYIHKISKEAIWVMDLKDFVF